MCDLKYGLSLYPLHVCGNKSPFSEGNSYVMQNLWAKVLKLAENSKAPTIKWSAWIYPKYIS